MLRAVEKHAHTHSHTHNKTLLWAGAPWVCWLLSKALSSHRNISISPPDYGWHDLSRLSSRTGIGIGDENTALTRKKREKKKKGREKKSEKKQKIKKKKGRKKIEKKEEARTQIFLHTIQAVVTPILLCNEILQGSET